MTLQRRILLAIGCLAAGAAGQLALQAHLAGGVSHPALRRPLHDFPLTLPNPQTGESDSNPVSLRAWLGTDQPESATLSAQFTFADELIARFYRLADAPIGARLYAVYSQRGLDREHHPEICMRDAAGCPEDEAAQALVYLGNDRTRAVQRFRFQTGTARFTYVYYWHYTRSAEVREGQSTLQALHERFGPRAPSVTVQVSSDAGPEDVKRIEESFLVAVDEAFRREVLPPTAKLGCERLPVRLIMH
jgi:hypothetical protein